MQNIHLIRAQQAAPFVEAFERLGAPVETIATQACFLLDAVRAGTGVIGEASAWRFVDLAAQHEDYALFGYDCLRMSNLRLGEGPAHMRLRQGGTLRAILENFVVDAIAESTASYYSIVDGREGSWFLRQQPFRGEVSSWQIEQYVIASIIEIVRGCAGSDWVPGRIDISAAAVPQQLPDEWSKCKISWGARTTGIQIPQDLMMSRQRNFPGPKSALNIAPNHGTLTFLDFVATQVRWQKSGLSNASGQLGVSESTIKRHLRKLCTSYTELVELARLKSARDMLARESKAITEIGVELGYGYLPNFSRAFKRMTGKSPQQYRDIALGELPGKFTNTHGKIYDASTRSSHV